MNQVTRRESRQMTRDICQMMQHLFTVWDGQAADCLKKHEAEGRKPSCHAGCDACCHIATVITRVESMAIADWIHRQPNWLDWAKRLVAAAQPYVDAQYNRHWYYMQHPPCPFLNLEHKCQIYEVRPAPCRYYYVFTPAEQCGDPVKQDVGIIDMYSLSLQVLAFQNSAFGRPDASCLPLMVLQGMMDVGWGCGRSDKIEALLKGLPSPTEWMFNCMKSKTDIDLKGENHIKDAWERLKAAGVPGTQ